MIKHLLISMLVLPACCPNSRVPRYNDEVTIIHGFYTGTRGRIVKYLGECPRNNGLSGIQTTCFGVLSGEASGDGDGYLRIIVEREDFKIER